MNMTRKITEPVIKVGMVFLKVVTSQVYAQRFLRDGKSMNHTGGERVISDEEILPSRFCPWKIPKDGMTFVHIASNYGRFGNVMFGPSCLN